MKDVKKLLLSLFVWISGVFLLSYSFAYTPSASLSMALENVVDRIESVINENGESMRDLFLLQVESYRAKSFGNDRAMYIIDYLVDNISTQEGGEWTIVNTINTTGWYFWSYSIDDAVYWSKVDVTVDSSSRSIESNALPNHETGTFPNSWNPNAISAQNKSREFPIDWDYVWGEERAREPWVAINGIKFEPETAERVECDSWEMYKIEAIQEEVNLWIDHQHAHVQPTGEYHYHWVSEDLVAFWAQVASNQDLVHVWFAADGFNMYYSKSWAYTPSFKIISEPRVWTSCEYRWKSVTIEWTTPDGTYDSDRTFDAWLWDLDACNWITLDGEYVYILTDEYPFISRCLNGAYEQQWPWGQWPNWSSWPGWRWPWGPWGRPPQ